MLVALLATSHATSTQALDTGKQTPRVTLPYIKGATPACQGNREMVLSFLLVQNQQAEHEMIMK